MLFLFLWAVGFARARMPVQRCWARSFRGGGLGAGRGVVEQSAL
ncbi:hypothetical protein ACU4GD_14745 [Cupriavidus basilensis]